jgi:predicted kinase
MMQLHAPGRDAPASPGVLRLPPAALLVVAGVPGAGKTTLLSRLDAPGSLVLDPEPIRARLEPRLGRVPYRLWRPLVHAGHVARVLLALPGRAGLVVHDTGTRGWRRRLLVRLARRCHRGAHLLLLDVSAEAAREGQLARRRVLPPAAFASHWRDWHRLRAALAAPGRQGPGSGGPGPAPSAPAGAGVAGAVPAELAAEGWSTVRLLDRPAADRLRRVEIPPR